ncbi:AAA ATPase, partial [Clavulina sp. PMI_390]
LKTSFKDVCLDPHIIDHVRTTISFPLKYPRAFSTGLLGTEAMSGILLYGPPGTGKTMLCRAVAKECNARMLIIQPSHVKDMWQGESEKLVRSIFTLARKIAPCIVFIDEVDAIFGSRTTSASSSTTHRSMLTEFMTEMDGLNSGAMNKKKGLVVIGATNRPFDLDDAILRRLPLRLLVDLPGLKERERIFRSLLKDENVDGIDVESLAKKTPNFSGSDIKNLTVSAALASLKDMI